MAEVVDHLRVVPLFQGLSERSLASVAALATERTFDPGRPSRRRASPATRSTSSPRGTWT
jgi:hypothetical protein